MPTSTQRLVRLLRTSAVRRLLKACFVRFLRAFGTQRDARWLSYRAGQELSRSHWRAAIDLGWPEEGLATARRAVGLAPDDRRARALKAQLAMVVDPFGQRERGH